MFSNERPSDTKRRKGKTSSPVSCSTHPTTSVMPAPLHWLQNISIFFSRHRGLRILSEWFRRIFVHTRCTVISDQFDGDLKFICELNEHIGSQIFWRGTYSRQVLRALEPFLGEDKMFVDVGANQGEFTLYAAKRLTKGSVIAFEPVSSMYERLARNVVLNGFQNVDLVKKALSDKSGSLPIYTPAGRFRDNSFNSGLPSLFKAGPSSDYLETIDVTTLDAYLEQISPIRVDAMKIDIEGSELPMLRGAVKSLLKFRPVLVIEISRESCRVAGYDSDEILSFITSLGYRIERILWDGGTRPVENQHTEGYENVICRSQ